MNAKLILLPALALFSSVGLVFGTSINGNAARISDAVSTRLSGNFVAGWNDNLKLGLQDSIGNSIASSSTFISSEGAHQSTSTGSGTQFLAEDINHTRGIATIPENQSTALAFGLALAVLGAVSSLNRRKRLAEALPLHSEWKLSPLRLRLTN